jgi:hypothetical protein
MPILVGTCMNFSAPPARPPACLPRPGKAGVGAVRSAPLMCHSHMHKRSLFGKELYSQYIDANTSCKATTCQHISHHHRLSTAASCARASRDIQIDAQQPTQGPSNRRVCAVGIAARSRDYCVPDIASNEVNTSTGYASGFIPSSTGEQLARARNGREIAGRMLVTAYTVSSGCDYTPTLNSRWERLITRADAMFLGVKPMSIQKFRVASLVTCCRLFSVTVLLAIMRAIREIIMQARGIRCAIVPHLCHETNPR